MTKTQRIASQVAVLLVAVLAWLGATSFSGQAAILTAYLLPGAAFTVAGVAAWSLRPSNRIGPLMSIAGVGLMLEADRNLVPTTPDWLPQLVAVFSFPLLVIPVQVLLAFPQGMLRRSRERGLVRFLYAITTLGGLSALAAFSLANQPAAAGIINGSAGLIYLGGLTIASGWTFRHWLKAGSAERRALTPVVLSQIPVLWAMLGEPLINLLPVQPDTPPSGFWALILNLNTGAPLLLIAWPAGILVGLLRANLDMSSVGELMVKLSHGMLPEQVQPALAQALHDPSLRVVYWLPTLNRFGDLEGNAVDITDVGVTSAMSVLGDPDNPVAALLYDPSLQHEGSLVEAAGAAVRLALENARLQAQLRAQLRDVRESRARLVDATDRERRRVERDLHDGAQQRLVSVLLGLQLAKTEALQRSEPETVRTLEENIDVLKRALAELRELARGIHPAILVEAGLTPAIRALADRCPVPVEIVGDVGRLDAPLEAALYFVAAEAMTNAAKHSQGRKVCVDLGRSNRLAFIDIADDGIGGADFSRGSGLLGLTDRIAAVGGRLEVQSNAGQGTKLHAEVPCV